MIRRRSLASAFLALSLVHWPALVRAQSGSSSHESSQNDADETVERATCSLGKASGRIVIESPDCGPLSCPQSKTVRVTDPGGRPLLTTEQDFDQRDSPEPLEIRCEGGAVVLTRLNTPAVGPEVRLWYDAKRRKLALAPSLVLAIQASFDAKASSKRLALFRTAVEAFRVILKPPPGIREGSPPPSNHIDGLDEALNERAELQLAQECIRAGEWLEAAELLAKRSRGQPVPVLLTERKRLVSELSSAQLRTRPLEIDERRPLGSVQKPQLTPLDPQARATLFWQGKLLCVVQEDEPARFMKCYNPARPSWSARVIVAWPRLDGQLLNRWSPARRQCPLGQEEELSLAADQLDTDCFYDWNSFIGLVDGPALLLAGPRLVFAYSKAADAAAARNAKLVDDSIDAKRVNALVARSAGTRALGQGQFWLEPKRNQLVEIGDQQKCWDLIGAPPLGEEWTGSPLASPDQSFIALQSLAKGGQVQLWLLHVTRRGGKPL